MAFYDILNPIMNPLLEMGHLIAILIISLVLAVIMTFIYKWMTDQKEMKRIKDQIKQFQKDIKAQKDNPKKALDIQKKAMEVNGQYMMKSMKPTLVTLIPILIIFGWMTAHMAYHPIAPGDDFGIDATFKKSGAYQVSIEVSEQLTLLSEPNITTEDDTASWKLKAGTQEGKYPVKIIYKDEEFIQYVKVTNQVGDYEPVIQKVTDKESKLKEIRTDIEKVRPFGEFSLFGWRLNWLWTYIIFSMAFSLGLRKLMKLH